jgi:hypothetical protein
MAPQNFSGRSIAYTWYTKAATLNNNDNSVMTSPGNRVLVSHAIAELDETEQRGERREPEDHHFERQHHGAPLTFST